MIVVNRGELRARWVSVVQHSPLSTMHRKPEGAAPATTFYDCGPLMLGDPREADSCI